MFLKIGVSILIGLFTINHPFWGTPIFGNTQITSSQHARVFGALAFMPASTAWPQLTPPRIFFSEWFFDKKNPWKIILDVKNTPKKMHVKKKKQN